MRERETAEIVALEVKLFGDGLTGLALGVLMPEPPTTPRKRGNVDPAQVQQTRLRLKADSLVWHIAFNLSAIL